LGGGNAAGGNIKFYTGLSTATPTERMVISDTGKIAISNNIPMWSGSYGGALVLKGNNATADRYAQLGIVDSTGALVATGLVVGTTGSVGIGTTNPAKLFELYSTSHAEMIINTTSNTSNCSVDFDLSGTRKGIIRYDHNATDADGKFEFYVGGNTSTQRMVIMGDGKVGIGTNDPAELFHVNGNGRFDDYLSVNTSGKYQTLTVNGNIWLPGSSGTITWSNGDCYIQSVSGYHMRLVTYDGVSAGVENLRLKSGGNVGVNGITDPLAPLHVKDKVDNSDTSGIIIERSANTQRGYISMRGGAFSFNTDSGLPIKFKDNGGTNMTILGDGNVGIGIESPTYKLHVSGTSTTLARFDGGGANNWVSITSSDTYSAGIVYENAGTGKWYVGHYNGAPGGFSFYDASTSSVKVFIEEGGNVGIGTTVPGSFLNLYSSEQRQFHWYAGTSPSGNNYVSTIGLGRDKGAASMFEIKYNSEGSEHAYISRLYPNAVLHFDKSGTDHMTILADGKVGIGTATPGVLLEISGTNPAFDITQSGTTIFRTELDGANDVYQTVYGAGNQWILRTNGGTAALTINASQNASFGGTISCSTAYTTHVSIATGSPVLVMKDTDSTGAAQVGYVSFQNSGGTEKGWIGYGSSGNTHLTIKNGHSSSQIVLDAPTTSVTGNFTVNTITSYSGTTTTFNDHLVMGGVSATASNRIYFDDTGGSEWYMEYNTAAGGGMRFVENGSATRVVFTDGGSVGIGTTTPTALLECEGSAAFNDGAYGTSAVKVNGNNFYNNTVTVNDTYTAAFDVNSSAGLSQSFIFTVKGTIGNTVIPATVEVQSNHYQDITIRSQAGNYTTLTVKVTTANNEDCTVWLKANTYNGGDTTCYIAVQCSSGGTVDWSSSEYSGTTLEHTCRFGFSYSCINGSDTSRFLMSGNMSRLALGSDDGMTSEPANQLCLYTASGNSIIDIEQTGNGNTSGINFIRQRSSGTGVNGGSIFMDSNTGSNNAALYIQAQSASAGAGVTTQLTASNGARIILRGGEGIIQWETGASERMRITAGGCIGIGTNSPSSILHVDSEISVGSDDNNRSMIGYNSSQDRLYIGTRQSSTNYLDTVSIRSGSVGIGTTNPVATLEVLGDAIIGSAATKLKTYSDSTYSGIYNGSSLGSDEAMYFGAGATYFYNDGAVSLVIDSNQRLQLKGADYQLQYVSGAHIWYNRLTSGGVFAIHKNGVGDYLRVDGSGNVGIGLNPSCLANLHINYNSGVTDTTAGFLSGVAGPGFKLQNTSTTTSTYAPIDFRVSDADARIAFQYSGVSNQGQIIFITEANSNSPKFGIYDKGDGATKILVNDTATSTAPNKTFHAKWSSSNTTITTGEGMLGGAAGTGVLIENTNSTAGIYANLDFRAYDADARIAVKKSASNTADFYFIHDNNGTAATSVLIKANGNVGIGTTSPTTPLHVVGNTVINGDLFFGSTSGSFVTTSSSNLRLAGDNGVKLQTYSGGWQDRLTIADGGAITFNTAFTFPTSDGSANQVLKTNGSGTLSWTDQSGGGGSGTVTEVTVGTGLDVSNGTSTPNITLDFNELSTAGTVTSTDDFIVVDGTNTRKEEMGSISLSGFSGYYGLINRIGKGSADSGTYVTPNSSGRLGFAEGTGVSLTFGTNLITFTTGTSSDYRLKKNISTFNSNAWAKVKSVNLRKFDFDEDAFKTAIDSPDPEIVGVPKSYTDNVGFIAHELAEVGIDGAVIGEKDAVDSDGNLLYQKVNYNALVPVLWGALNEAISKIETLESKVQALEDK
jgi:hypothetical protein